MYKITGGMKAEVMRNEKNLGKMRAANHVRQLTMWKEAGVGGRGGGTAAGGPRRLVRMRRGGGGGLSPFLVPGIGGRG